MSTASFSQTDAEARTRFLAAAAAAGLDSQAHIHPLLGREGEPLALDVVRDGPGAATRLSGSNRASRSQRGTLHGRATPVRAVK